VEKDKEAASTQGKAVAKPAEAAPAAKPASKASTPPPAQPPAKLGGSDK